MIIAGIASMAKRHASLIDTVNSLTPQVDMVHVYCEPGHPAQLTDFNDPSAVELIGPDEYGEDMGDAGKFYRAGDYPDAFYLSCDDDLIYPEDYAETVTDAITSYGGRVIVGFHGVIMKKNPTHYYRDRTVYHGLGDVEEDKYVHIIGTCSCGFHTKHVPLKYSDFRSKNIADIWISLYAQDNQVPVVCLGHDGGWIVHTCKIDHKETLFHNFHTDKAYPGNQYIGRKWAVYPVG